MTTATEAMKPQLQGSWRVDPRHSSVEFAVRHMMIATVSGRFRDYEGTLDATGDELVLEGVVRVESLTTDDEQRDGHLVSPDFFDAERHPEIRFRSRRFEPTGERTVRVVGEFTMRGVTKELELAGRLAGAGVDPWGSERIGIDLEATIDRREYGLTWNQPLPSGGVLVGDDVRLILSFSLVKAEA
jgi:polyisoprenoid-binding protein YceI